MQGAFFPDPYSASLMKYKSDGLIGAARTWISTYPSFGTGIGIYRTASCPGPSSIRALIVSPSPFITNL